MIQTDTKRPFIIWTLQRSGGTNLARRLFERSALLDAAMKEMAARPVQPEWLGRLDSQWKLHEPFNMGDEARVFGRITEKWTASGDVQALEAALDEICALKLPIKHCVEMVPWELSQALAKVATRHGYQHLFLYRENGLNRLLSLQYAKLTGIWGAHFVGERELEQEIFDKPLPIEELIGHQTHCNRLLSDAWSLLQSLGADPIAARFEDIYEVPGYVAKRDAVVSLLHFLELAEGIESDERFASETIAFGEQGTRRAYNNFKQTDELKKRLEAVEQPSFSTQPCPVAIENNCAGQPILLHAVIDNIPQSVQPGAGFDIGGVLVLKEALPLKAGIYMNIGGLERRFQWGIQSPAMGRQFPKGANSHNARFKMNGVRCRAGQQAEVVLRYGDGHSVPLFRLSVGPSDACPQ